MSDPTLEERVAGLERRVAAIEGTRQEAPVDEGAARYRARLEAERARDRELAEEVAREAERDARQLEEAKERFRKQQAVR